MTYADGNPCHDVWEELDEAERYALFGGLYTYMAIQKPAVLLQLELISRREWWDR